VASARRATTGTSWRAWAIYAGVLATFVASLVWWRQRAPTTGQTLWLVGLMMQTIIRAPWVRATRQNHIVASRRTTRDTLLLGAMFLATLLLPLLAVGTPLLDAAELRPPAIVTACGTIVLAACLWLFWRSHRDLGRNWSPTLEVRDAHGLVSTGIYSSMRHPMYASIWLGVVAQACLIDNLVPAAAGPVAMAMMYFGRIAAEERMLAERFGDEWEAYVSRTGRLWPRRAGAVR
jgi:protein-S-isoprenylcysteine O-methyltransferase Ste14